MQISDSQELQRLIQHDVPAQGLGLNGFCSRLPSGISGMTASQSSYNLPGVDAAISNALRSIVCGIGSSAVCGNASASTNTFNRWRQSRYRQNKYLSLSKSALWTSMGNPPCFSIRPSPFEGAAAFESASIPADVEALGCVAPGNGDIFTFG